MLLTIDIGNTTITLGTFDDGPEPEHHWRIETDRDRLADEYGLLLLGLMDHEGLDVEEVEGVALASVVPPLTPVFVEMVLRYFDRSPLVVDTGVRTGIKIRYDSARDVGADRIVDAVAALEGYGGPVCIVDFGTATTFDAVSASREYLGGAIAPGIGIGAEALSSRTSKLPRIDLVRPPSAIGSNTVHAMQSGMVFGYVGLVEALVERFKKELGPGTRVVATGGQASIIADETDVIEEVDPWLTLKGLRIVWELNQ